MLAGGMASIDNISFQQAGSRYGSALGAHRPDDCALGLCLFRTTGRGWNRALNVYFRVAPDIFYADRPNAVLKLAYRYNSIPIGRSPACRWHQQRVPGVDSADTRTRGLGQDGDEVRAVVNLRPFSISFIRLHVSIAEEGGCQDTTRSTCRAPSCATPTWIFAAIALCALPTGAFRQCGFPFTRFADLGETT